MREVGDAEPIRMVRLRCRNSNRAENRPVFVFFASQAKSGIAKTSCQTENITAKVSAEEPDGRLLEMIGIIATRNRHIGARMTPLLAR